MAGEGIVTRAVTLRSRPQGVPVPENFELRERQLPPLADGQVLIDTIILSVVPAMRSWMDEQSYLGPGIKVGRSLAGPATGVVRETRHRGLAEGDVVQGLWPWQEQVVLDGGTVRKLETRGAPLELWSSVLGNSAFAAWVGMTEIGKPQAGETVVVSAASGGVGAIAGQLARRAGARVVGIAGGPAKCAYVVERLGYDACLDHRLPDLGERLDAACPDGVDVNFENVGGEVLAAVFARMNRFGRVVMCGMVAEYNRDREFSSPNFWPIVSKELTVRGFLSNTYNHLTQSFLEEMTPLALSGEIHQPVHVGQGLDQAPAAFIDLLSGAQLGKCLVRLRPDP